MAGYIGNKSSVTLVDGYSEAEANAEFVTKTGDTMSGNLDVTGTVTSDGLTVDTGGVALLKTATDDNIRISQQTHASIQAVNDAVNAFTELKLDGSSLLLNSQSSGNVGIGTSSPSADFVVSNGGAAGIELQPEITTDTNRITNYDRAASAYMNFRLDGLTHQFLTSGTERMRIHSNGRVSINSATDNIHGVTARVKINALSSEGTALSVYKSGTSNSNAITFHNDNGIIGSIKTNGSSTSYNTSSDYRLKENVVSLTGASARVNQLDVKRFNFIADDTNTLVDGFLAHEVATVVPEAITGTKDAMKDEEYEVTPATGDIYTPATDEVDEVIHSADAEQPETLEDGQQWRETTATVMGTRSVPDMQGIDQSKLVPLLTAALQEALTEIASLKTRVEALEDV